MPGNLEIAQQANLRPVREIAHETGLREEDFDTLGRYKAKLTLAGMKRLASEKPGKLILVTAITPTPAGEGKTTVSVGLAQGLKRIGKNALPALREPALGPIFGVKGGATGGGYSQVLPMEEINLFFTGDFAGIGAAHNLLSAMLDASLHHHNPLDIDLGNIWWPRAVDMIDRSLREIVVGLGHGNGPVRSDGFVIIPASEIMAVLCLSSSVADLKERIARIVVATGAGGKPITAGHLGATGAMTVLLKDAIRPNLVQTIEGGLALLHGGPFGNIAHGCSSILATKCGLGLADYLVTEAGFGSDLGAEKFLQIVVPQLGVAPDAIVLVATVRALRHQGEGDLQSGMENLGRHLRHLTSYGPPVVVAVNRFADDCATDLEAVMAYAREHSAAEAVVADPWASGGPGCEDLGHAVVKAAEIPSTFKPMYEPDDPIIVKLDKVTRGVYGGAGVTCTTLAERRMNWADRNGYGHLPVCVAKTQSSVSDDPRLLGAPNDFKLHVREVRISAGAGFLVAVSGDVMLMPGMGKAPNALRMEVDDDGVIHGMN